MNILEAKIYESATTPIAIAPDLVIGGDKVVLMAGPCSVESYEQTRTVAETLYALGVPILRGGAFKPRTSPHSFQGLGVEGLKILHDVADEFGLLVITEALGVEHVPLVMEYADIIQIGSRNMQHFPLLWAVGETTKPVLLKRGFMSTVTEWLLAAEHIATRGNERIILCERGIRSFGTETRNTLDTNAIALAKLEAHWPVIGDPSHATGRADLVLPASRAGIAGGADGLLVEVHPHPAGALSDGGQSLTLPEFSQLVSQVGKIAQAMGRSL
ncbi:MAG TPA: 3-deoxy-7-phosphoheptulonate synthase [Anaerolineales bacterium]|nr:3-deoxy-7-phosphoheptulonate synthase [Anaerolineales bacterium]